MIAHLDHYDAIIFDMDGTLIDSMPAHMDAWRLAADAHGFPYDHDWHYSQGGVPTRKTVELINERYGLNLDLDAVAETKRQKWEDMGLAPVLIAETHSVFIALTGKKPIAVGTGAEREHAIDMLEATGLMSQLNALVTACDVVQGKPSPDTFLKAAQALGVEPSKCVVFEDTEIGRRAAQSAGMDCILVIDGKIQWPK